MQDANALDLVDSFEASFDVAAMRFTAYEMPPWAYLRFLLAQVVADRIAQTTYYVGWARSEERLGDLRYVARTLAELPRSLSPRPAKVLIFGSGAANVRTADGYHNRLVDHFARASGAAVYEDSYASRYALPRRLTGVRYHDPLRALAAVGGKLRPLPHCDAKIIAELMARASRHFKDVLRPADIAALRRRLVGIACRIPFWHWAYHRVLSRTQPRLCIIEDACYGMYTHLLAWSHDAGIATAEYQHGQTYMQHPAYRLSPALQNPKWANYLPQHYLAWGQDRVRPLRLPIKVHVIGYPDLSERSRTLRQGAGERAQVLFISSGLDIQLYQRVLAEVGSAAGGRYSLAFRPHPAERASAQQRYGEILSRYGWRLDLESDPYASLAKSALVVGDVSTTMFEALEFECSVVLIDAPLTRKLMPEDVFSFSNRFDNLDALLAAGRKAQAARQELWADNWQDRFRRFLSDYAEGGRASSRSRAGDAA